MATIEDVKKRGLSRPQSCVLRFLFYHSKPFRKTDLKSFYNFYDNHNSFLPEGKRITYFTPALLGLRDRYLIVMEGVGLGQQMNFQEVLPVRFFMTMKGYALIAKRDLGQIVEFSDEFAETFTPGS